MFYLWIFTILAVCYCLPPRHRSQPEPDEPKSDEGPSVSLEGLGIEYTRYLQQVVEALEKDDHFKQKLEKAQPEEIQSAKIAEELEFVNHKVRSKLDELKRYELQRLRDLARKMNTNEHEYHHSTAGHVDHNNPNTFEVSDLKKLIRKAVVDLEEADKKRKEQFKNYELEKHFEREQKLKNMTEDDKKKFLQHEEELRKQEEEAKKKVHHPGSKQQLEEVWEQQDHMNKNDFNPRTFFAIHDVDGNGFLDEEEVKALFLQELKKLYGPETSERDTIERDEELERMREHVFKEVDKNHDRLIDWEEFHSMSARNDFNEDPGWQPIHDQQIYSDDEWLAYEKQRLAAEEGFYQHPQQVPVQINETHYQYVPYPSPNVHHGANDGGYHHPAGAVPPPAGYPPHGNPPPNNIPQQPSAYMNIPVNNQQHAVPQASMGNQIPVVPPHSIPAANQQHIQQQPIQSGQYQQSQHQLPPAPQGGHVQHPGAYQQPIPQYAQPPGYQVPGHQSQQQSQPGVYQHVPVQQVQQQAQYAVPSQNSPQQSSPQFNSNQQQSQFQNMNNQAQPHNVVHEQHNQEHESVPEKKVSH